LIHIQSTAAGYNKFIIALVLVVYALEVILPVRIFVQFIKYYERDGIVFPVNLFIKRRVFNQSSLFVNNVPIKYSELLKSSARICVNVVLPACLGPAIKTICLYVESLFQMFSYIFLFMPDNIRLQPNIVKTILGYGTILSIQSPAGVKVLAAPAC
jgi:hypothetical protein